MLPPTSAPHFQSKTTLGSTSRSLGIERSAMATLIDWNVTMAKPMALTNKPNTSATKHDKWASSFGHKSKVDKSQSTIPENPWDRAETKTLMWVASYKIDTAPIPSLWEVAILGWEKANTTQVDHRDDVETLPFDNGEVLETDSLVYSDHVSVNASSASVLIVDKGCLSSSFVSADDNDDDTDYSTDNEEESEIFSIPESIYQKTVAVSVLTELDGEEEEYEGEVIETFDDLSVLTEDSGFWLLGLGEEEFELDYSESAPLNSSKFSEDTAGSKEFSQAVADVLLLEFLVGICTAKPSGG